MGASALSSLGLLSIFVITGSLLHRFPLICGACFRTISLLVVMPLYVAKI